jgi:uncharacterized lipoprotein YmbA
MLCIISISTSCIFRPYSAVQYYDITLPTAENDNLPEIKIPIVLTKGPYRTKMVYRNNKRELYFDDKHRWSQTPENLLKKYLELTFLKNDMSENKPYKLNIEILLFEINQDNKETIFAAKYTIITPSGIEKNYSIKLKKDMPAINASVFAENISEIFKDFSNTIKENIKQIK